MAVRHAAVFTQQSDTQYLKDQKHNINTVFFILLGSCHKRINGPVAKSCHMGAPAYTVSVLPQSAGAARCCSVSQAEKGW